MFAGIFSLATPYFTGGGRKKKFSESISPRQIAYLTAGICTGSLKVNVEHSPSLLSAKMVPP
jgi:hypothetical protein